MPLLIDEDQCGFIQGRQTQDCIRRTLHIIEYIKKEKLSATLLSMDAQKVFDSVGWEFLYNVMERFGFHEMFIKSVKTLYTSPMARIKVQIKVEVCLKPYTYIEVAARAVRPAQGSSIYSSSHLLKR